MQDGGGRTVRRAHLCDLVNVLHAELAYGLVPWLVCALLNARRLEKQVGRGRALGLKREGAVGEGGDPHLQKFASAGMQSFVVYGGACALHAPGSAQCP